MTNTQHLIVTKIVTHEQWVAERPTLLAAIRTVLWRQAQLRGLRLQGVPAEDITHLLGGTHLRITVRVDGILATSAHQEPGGTVDVPSPMPGH